MAAANRPEAELIASARSGDMGAFAQLVGLHRMRVLRTAAGIVGSVHEAEDVAQLVFMRVWDHLDDYDSAGSFTSWLYRITVNLSIDTLRRRRYEAELNEELQAGARSDPEALALHADERRRVQRAVAQLPDKTRAALILREYEQLSYKEIAEALKIPIGTVMSRLNYARRSLDRLLREEQDEQREASEP